VLWSNAPTATALFIKVSHDHYNVGEYDEGRRQDRSAAVFFNELVTLHLPQKVRLLLNLIERVAGERRKLYG
jgi:hypothetical protein